ncbi:MAG: YARHG domain-containing protein [Crocinitomicaceae bacterium]
MKSTSIMIIMCALMGCTEQIKNSEKVQDEVVGAGSKNAKGANNPNLGNTNTQVIYSEDLIGHWVGWFESDMGNDDKSFYLDEGYYWGRENKITISFEQIEGEVVKGHSIVAGNHRPFTGNIKKSGEDFSITVNEPGDDKYDGKFTIQLKKNAKELQGTWKAFKAIQIDKRKFVLTKKIFNYNPNQAIENSKMYVDWNRTNIEKYKNEYEEEVYESISYSIATGEFSNINASATLLKRSDLENLSKGDLRIIRNAIYARHGYSFKNRPLRIFFDAQEWYMPISTDVKAKLTDLEKKNIQLLLQFEKNATEYYDTFGRG